jgi:site-specific recombinase XerC
MQILSARHVRDWRRGVETRRQPSLRTIDTHERLSPGLRATPPSSGVDDVSDVDLLLMLETVPLKSHRLHRSAWNGFFKWAIKRGRRSAINPVDDLRLCSTSPASRPQDLHRGLSGPRSRTPRGSWTTQPMTAPGHGCSSTPASARVRSLRLRVGDVDPTGRCITVLGKGGKERLIPIRGEFWQEWELFLMAPIPKLGWPLELTDYVWFPMRVAGEYGNRARQVTASYPDRPMGECSMHSWWTRLCGHSGVDYRKLHMARHTFATDALDSTEGDLYGVSEMPGHSSKVTEVHLTSKAGRSPGRRSSAAPAGDNGEKQSPRPPRRAHGCVVAPSRFEPLFHRYTRNTNCNTAGFRRSSADVGTGFLPRV